MPRELNRATIDPVEVDVNPAASVIAAPAGAAARRAAAATGRVARRTRSRTSGSLGSSAIRDSDTANS